MVIGSNIDRRRNKRRGLRSEHKEAPTDLVLVAAKGERRLIQLRSFVINYVELSGVVHVKKCRIVRGNGDKTRSHLTYKHRTDATTHALCESDRDDDGRTMAENSDDLTAVN
jgi:hypothetical protein